MEIITLWKFVHSAHWPGHMRIDDELIRIDSVHSGSSGLAVNLDNGDTIHNAPHQTEVIVGLGAEG